MLQVHIITGIIALLSGILALSFKKGSKKHKMSGKVFVISMLLVSLSSISLSVLRPSISYFFLTIGWFSLYFTLTGVRALKIHKRDNLNLDLALNIIFLLGFISIILHQLYFKKSIQIPSLVFNLPAVVVIIREFFTLFGKKINHIRAISIHINKIMTAFIATLTAFIVANNIINSIWGWLLPTILGVPIIVYYDYHIKKFGKVKK
jgi:uncharacterized membrane protein